MIRRALVLSAAVATAALVTFGVESDASACGGCFGPPPPPTEQPTVVTDHRMILSISKEQSTLYDQIRYQGSPASFAWVLPIAGTVEIGLSANIVFQALDQFTQQTIIAPPLNCPQQPTGCNQFGSRNATAGASAPAEDSQGGGVQVIKQEVVGPYETVQLKSEDPNALTDWLEQHGYTIADDIKPVINQYVTEKFNFLALKLVPGKDVKDMRPVRVTTTGAGAVLPLRMVAAGTGANVGITLWTVSEGRYQPQNFPSFYITTDELVWDWTKQQSNYTDLRAQKTATSLGRSWETESSVAVYRQNIESVVTYGAISQGGGTGGGASAPYYEQQAANDYLPKEDDQGNVTRTASQVRQDDMDTLFFGIPATNIRVTRIRADLSRAALDQDLQMTAAADQSVLSPVRQVTKELNEPACPVFDGCTQVGTAPRSEAIARSSGGGNETFSACATAVRSHPSWFGTGGGLMALALVHVARRRRSKR
jgi:hypothetical protein